MRLKSTVVVLGLFLLTGSLAAQERKPKLVIGMVVDQMRWDYLVRYASKFSSDGFNRLLQKGYSFDNTQVPYTPTVTAAGHTCIFTGSVPAIHGIVGNDFIDRDLDGYLYCTGDRTVQSVGTFSKQGQMSPRNMLSTTIGDELRLATNFRSRVFGIAQKDRGGILPAGHSANAAYWFDDSTGNWISSTYYMNQLPAWVDNFNKARKVDSMMNQDWNLLYPLSYYTESTADDMPFEKNILHETNRTFPHVYRSQVGKNYYSFRQSPYGNTHTLEFAKLLLQKEQLGLQGNTDMLCISLSSTDYVGHRFGPNSLEVEDTYLRLDKDIAAFLRYLDAMYGAGNYLVFLSADHGAPQVPDFMKAHQLPGGSLSSFNLRNELNAMLSQQFAANNLVRAIYEYQVYLDTRRIDSLKLDDAAIRKSIIALLKSKPEVVNAFDYKSFDQVMLPEAMKQKFANGYFYKRSGDIQFILKPSYTDVLSTGTEHGTMYAYDTHIPLVWYGWHIRPGKTHREVYMTDIAPTVAALLNIQMPSGCVGKVLGEIVP